MVNISQKCRLKMYPPKEPTNINSRNPISTWKDWLEVSSFHGISDISRPRYGHIWKLTWLLVIITFTGFAGYSIYGTVNEWLENPTIQNYREEAKGIFDLPDVIICTYQRFNITELKRMGASDELISALTASMTDLPAQLFQDDLSNKLDISEIKKQYNEFRNRNKNITFEKIMAQAGVKCDGLIKSCDWGFARPCCQDATPVFDKNYGQCYRFKTMQIVSLNSSIWYYQNFPGPGSGVQMAVRSTISGCGSAKSDAINGILIEIAYPGESMTYTYQQVPSGVMATVHVSLQLTERINIFGRTRTCNDVPTLTKDINELENNRISFEKLKTSANGCFYAYWSQVIFKYCNCSMMPGLAEMPMCEPFDNCPLPPDCWNEIKTLQMANCLPQSKRYSYTTTITYSNFNAALYNKAAKLKDPIENDVILLDIYHPKMEYVHIKEVEVYSIITLVSNIGGAVGLWLGASLMSILQLIFYFIKWISEKAASAKRETLSYSYQQIPSGVTATVHLQLQLTERINVFGRPQTCNDVTSQSVEEIGNNGISFEMLKRSANGCFYAYWTQVIFKYCNCSMMPGIVDMPMCEPFDNCQLPPDYLAETRALQAKNCLPQSKRFSYTTSITYSNFDAALFSQATNQKDPVENDLIFLDIYHPKMEYVHIKEVEVYSIITLVSNIGGAVGLWLGASLMSILQLIFYFIKWISEKSNSCKT